MPQLHQCEGGKATSGLIYTGTSFQLPQGNLSLGERAKIKEQADKRLKELAQQRQAKPPKNKK